MHHGCGRDQPIEFLRIIGEYCAVKYHHIIANVFRSTTPDYCVENGEPIYPALENAEKPNQFEKTVIAGCISDMKDWNADQKKIKDDKVIVYALVMGQLSDSSRGEVKDVDFDKNYSSHNLIHLIERRRASHIAVQSGNARQD